MRRKSFVRLIIAILIIACVVPFFEPTWAQEPTQMTLEGTHSGAIAPTAPCFACIPPSASGSIKLVVDFETGSVSGEVSGSGAGEATADICDEDDQPTGERHTASGEITYSGTIIGSIDPQSGAISAKTTLQITSTKEGGPWPMEATITGVVKRDGSASGKFYWATGACAFDAAWNAQATSIVYPPSPTPSPQPTETHTPEPTETPTPEPTETPTPEPTETPTPEPTETPTLEPTETSTPEPKGVLPISDDQDRDKTADLVRNLEQLLAGQGVKGPTPDQAAAGAVAVSILSAIWGLANILSGASTAPPDTPERQADTPKVQPPAEDTPATRHEAKLRRLQGRFEELVDEALKANLYVMNRNLIEKAWNWTFGGVINFMRGKYGGQCGEFAEWGTKWTQVYAEEIFGEGVIVDPIRLEESSFERTPVLIKDPIEWADRRLYRANHAAVRVILPNGESYVLDFWQAVGDRQRGLYEEAVDYAYDKVFSGTPKKPEVKIMKESQWIKKWSDKIGEPGDRAVAYNLNEDQHLLKSMINTLGDEEGGIQAFRRSMAGKLSVQELETIINNYKKGGVWWGRKY